MFEAWGGHPAGRPFVLIASKINPFKIQGYCKVRMPASQAKMECGRADSLTPSGDLPLERFPEAAAKLLRGINGFANKEGELLNESVMQATRKGSKSKRIP